MSDAERKSTPQPLKPKDFSRMAPIDPSLHDPKIASIEQRREADEAIHEALINQSQEERKNTLFLQQETAQRARDEESKREAITTQLLGSQVAAYRQASTSYLEHHPDASPSARSLLAEANILLAQAQEAPLAQRDELVAQAAARLRECYETVSSLARERQPNSPKNKRHAPETPSKKPDDVNDGRGPLDVIPWFNPLDP